MAEFIFPLQRVMEMRRDKVVEVERALEERYAAREKLREVLMQQRDLYFSERLELNGYITRSELAKMPLLESSLDLRKSRMLEILEGIKEVEADIDFLQNALVVAKRDFKVVEKLREKRFSEWLTEEETKERKNLDEMATVRHQRKEYAERIEEAS